MLSRLTTSCIAAFIVLLASFAFGQGTDPNGFPTRYLVLGPIPNSGGAAPGDDRIRADYLCDGTVTQETIRPRPGLQLDPPDAGGCAPDGVSSCSGPTIQVLDAANTTLDLNAALVPNDNVMAYAWVWVENLTGDAVNGTMGVGSDDSFEALVNGESIGLRSIGRGCGGAGVIQDDGMPVTLEPGANLVGVKVFEGGGGWCCRFRLLDEFGSPITDDGIDFRVTTDLAEDVTATRSFEVLADDVQVTIDVENEAAGPIGIVETFHPSWNASDVSGGGEISAGRIEWDDAPDSVSYVLTRDAVCSPDVAVVDGIVSSESSGSAIGGDTVIPDCTVQIYVPEVLVTPSFRIPDGVACTISPAGLREDWITGVTGDGDDYTDRTFVPEDGLEFSPDFDILRSTGFSDIDPFARETFWTDPDDPEFTAARLGVAFAGGNGVFDWQSVYGLVDQTMNAAFFYVVSDSDQGECVWIGLGSDDSASVRVNGYPAFEHAGCRGHGGFTDRTRIWLDPGKNLVSFYTFEGGGGYGACVRFEDETGAAVEMETTLDPVGYDPADHPPPPPGCGGSVGGLSSQGFVTQFLVPARVLDQPLRGAPPADAEPADYIAIVVDGEPAAPSVDNVVEGAVVDAGLTGRITERVRPVPGGGEEFTRLALFQGEGADAGLFDGEAYYGGADDYSSTGFFFLENHTDASLTAYLSFASDDGAHLFVGDELVLQHLSGRGFGPANTIQNGPAPVTLDPGRTLCQLSYVEGGGGSGFRVRVTKSCDGATLFSPAEVTASASSPDVRGFATRRIDSSRDGFDVLAAVSITIDDEPGEVTVSETPGPAWTVTEVSDGGVVVDGRVEWTTTGRRVSYSMVSNGPCGLAQGRVEGLIDLTDGRRVPVRGESVVSLCDAPEYVAEVLLTPGLSALGCNPSPEQIAGEWIEDGSGLEIDRGIVPEDGLEFLPDFGGASQAIELHPA